jgi:hypothetical protein
MKIFDWLYATILFDMNMKIETLYIINSMLPKLLQLKS